MLMLSQMSKEITISVIDNRSVPRTSVTTMKGSCTYCGSHSVFYTWCRKCLNEMAIIKNLIKQAHRLPNED